MLLRKVGEARERQERRELHDVEESNVQAGRNRVKDLAEEIGRAFRRGESSFVFHHHYTNGEMAEALDLFLHAHRATASVKLSFTCHTFFVKFYQKL